MNGFSVKTHDELSKVTDEQFRLDPCEIMTAADHGIQTAVVTTTGKIRSIVGLNGVRYLPDPDPDPLEEILRLALENALEREK